jgi:hypothetical protein
MIASHVYIENYKFISCGQCANVCCIQDVLCYRGHTYEHVIQVIFNEIIRIQCSLFWWHI